MAELLLVLVWLIAWCGVITIALKLALWIWHIFVDTTGRAWRGER